MEHRLFMENTGETEMTSLGTPSRFLALLVGTGVLSLAACGGNRTSAETKRFTPQYSHLQEAWDPTNDPLIFSSEYNRKFKSLPRKGKVLNEPWSDTYWPSKSGGIAVRWNATNPELNKPAWDYDFLTKEQVIALPESDRAQLSPAEKYDIYTGRFDYPTTKWQRQNTSPSDEGWWGLCHGWSPASYLFKEPSPVTLKSVDGILIPFGSSDVKAMLTLQLATEGSSVLLGQRCNADLSTNPDAGKTLPCRDTNAGSFHMVMANQMGILGQSFSFDLVRDKQVWNQPVLSYKTKTLGQRPPSAQAAPGTKVEYRVMTEVTYVSEQSSSWKPHVGVDNALANANYEYYVEVDRKGLIVGGSWITDNRPDFLWTTELPSFTGSFTAVGPLYRASIGEESVAAVPVQQAQKPIVLDQRCQAGGTFDASIGYCLDTLPSGQIIARGQFTTAMIDRCLAVSGGQACRQQTAYELPNGNIAQYQQWDRDLTAQLRGQEECAYGSQRQAGYGGFCVESTRRYDGKPIVNAYGPFSQELVQKCVAASGGSACYTLRWDAHFLQTLQGAGG
jgi:Transglutaminase elicitor